MNGILTIRDEATRKIINQPVFIPFIFLKVDNGQNSATPQIVPSSNNLRITNVENELQEDEVENELLPPIKHIANEHDYCIINDLSCLKNYPLLGGVENPNRALGLKPKVQAATENNTTSLVENEIIVSDLSNDSDENKTNEEVDLLCSEVFQSPSNLKRPKEHVRRERKQYNLTKKVKKCYKCGKDIRNGLLSFHLAKHRRDDQKKLEYEREREKRKEEKKLASLTCGTCNERFDTKEEFQYHLQLHPRFICDNCGRGFAKKDSFNAHKNTHNDPNSFICEVCGKGYKDSNALRVHSQLHENKTFKCTFCPKTFAQKCRLSNHIRRMHKEPPSFQCSYCGKLFTNRAGHNLHVKLIHFKEKPYECNVCHKKFGRRDYLTNHKYCHTGQPRPKRNKSLSDALRINWPKSSSDTIKENGEPVPCKFCGKAFQTVTGMKRHLVSHVKRYSCRFCPLTFSMKASCQRHEKIHEDGEFFRCNVCWKRFDSQETLDEHSACHTNARYTCELCGKTFNRRHLMNHHRLMNHIDTSDKEKAKKIIIDSLLEASGKH
ncbi:zinc finger protein 235-like [Anoplophora glabripennis]|uniref:zinc finger protein 235-like n=1 Tax=Anoplophora glabripennis TaxID=217634 RepID=UPI0008746F4E|nr:zinc finger protein 235-like [Anoplophora glabripennis]XP_018565341.1 zinc finger protein 235-like [Anoplophora glabripennis]